MESELAVKNETVVQTKNPILEKPRLFSEPSQEAGDTHHAVTFSAQPEMGWVGGGVWLGGPKYS